MKRRQRDRLTDGYDRAQEKSRGVAILKRTLRRLQSGQQLPFLVATLEPKTATDGQVHAVPAILSLRLDDPATAFLVAAVLKHLVDVGALKAGKKPEVLDGNPDPVNTPPDPVNEESPG